MKKILKIVSVTFLLFIINFLQIQSFAQIEPGLVDGWYVRDSRMEKTIISYVKEYLGLNDKTHYEDVTYLDDVIIFKSIRPSSKEYPLEGMYVGKYKIENAEKLFIILGKTIYDFVKDRDKYDWELFEFIKEEDKCQLKAKNVDWWPDSKAQFSAFHTLFKVEKNWGFDGTIGLDQMNYPWWYAGVFRAGFMHQRVRLGIQGPIGMGYPSSGSLRSRLLDAGWGGYLSFNIDGFVGDFFYGDLAKRANEQFRDWGMLSKLKEETYFLSLGGMMGYSFNVDITDFMPAALRISVGGEYHQVGQGHIENEISKDVIKDKRIGAGGPFLRFDLIDCGQSKYDAFAQYANSSLMIGGAYNFTKTIGLEARFVITEPLRTREPWEHSALFMISPRIRF